MGEQPKISQCDRRGPDQKVKLGDMRLVFDKDILLKISDDDRKGRMLAQIGKQIPPNVPFTITESGSEVKVDFQNYATLVVSHQSEDRTSFYDIEWKGYGKGANCGFEDQFFMQSHWYGCGHVWRQDWPIEKWNEKMCAMVAGEANPVQGGMYGGVQERYFLCSDGAAIFADFDVPLFTSVNHKKSGKLVFYAKYDSPYRKPEGDTVFLKYKICTDLNILMTHQNASARFWPNPTGIPDEDMFRYPIWSTWAQYKKDINHEKVIDFAEQIQNRGFKAAQIEIDDDWTPHYGDMEFDPKKFPNPKETFTKLKEMGYRVTIWVHPFISSRGSAYKQAYEKDFLIKGMFNRPGTYIWWNGTSALLDLTNPDAVAWYVNNLKQLAEDYGVASFKFDAGEGTRFSNKDKTKVPMQTPNFYTNTFAKLAHSVDTDLRAQEIRVGYGNQDLPMFFRLQDKDSNWDHSNGLKTVIPHILTQGLIGYPFVLPDMIGGNAYALFGRSAYPDRELYIRWMQVNALLPTLQFSVVPWLYDDEVISIALEVCKLHEQYADKILDLAREATNTGAPICRPLWWIAPSDESALTNDTEFLLGNDILVAPILDKGARERQVYLPAGQWRDELHDTVLSGNKTHVVKAELNQLPIFTKVDRLE